MKASLHTRIAHRCAEMMRALAQAEVTQDAVERRELIDKARKYNGAISRILLEPGKGTRVAGKKRARLPDVNQIAAE